MNSGGLSTNAASVSYVGTAAQVYVSQSAAISNFSPTLPSTGILAVSIIQVGQPAGSQFGVKWNATGSYPYSSFMKYEGGVAYFKCLSTTCRTGKIADLDGTAFYLVSAYYITDHAPSDEVLSLQRLENYMAGANQLLTTIGNHLINVNNSVAKVEEQIRVQFGGVYTWLQQIATYSDSMNQVLMKMAASQVQLQAEAEETNARLDQMQQQADADRQSAQAVADQDVQEVDDQGSSGIISAGIQVLSAPATSCRIDADGKLPLHLDFCADPRPSWLAPVMVIGSWVTAFMFFRFAIPHLWRRIEEMRR